MNDNAMGAKSCNPLTRHQGVGVQDADKDLLNLGLDQGLTTGWRAARVRTGLKRHVDRCALDLVAFCAGIPECHHLSVRMPRSLCVAQAQNLARLGGDDTANPRIGGGEKERRMGLLKRQLHEGEMGVVQAHAGRGEEGLACRSEVPALNAKFIHQGFEFIDVFKVFINTGKTNIGHFV